MIPGLDSATPPTTAQAQAARAAGVRLWAGYLATRANVNLLNPWTPAQFEVARLCGATPIAYCSGLDDPISCRAMAAALNVRLCLDVEGGIRGDGSWVQPWLAAAGTDRTGLYGNAPVHPGRRAAFHVLADYPGYDPRSTWSGPRPAAPCAWQWRGSHIEFGISVDRGWYDDWFAAPQEEDMAYKLVRNGTTRTVADVTPSSIFVILPDLTRKPVTGPVWQAYQQLDLAAAPFAQDVAPEYIAEFPLAAAAVTPDDVKAAIKAELDTLAGHSDPAVASAVARIEAALKQA